MCGRKWTEDEVAFLRANYPAQSAYWCAQQLGRGHSSVAVKLSGLKLLPENPRPPKVEREDPDLGPVEPQFAHHCVDCGRVSLTQRCPTCQEKHLARYHGECWGPTADEAYGVAL